MSEHNLSSTGDRRSRDRATLALLVASLTAAIAFTPSEFGHYRRLLDPDHDPLVRLGIVLGVLSKTLAAFALAGSPALILLARGRRRAGFAWGGIASLLVLGYLGIDIEVQRFTGNSLSSYAAYLGEPDAMRWAGEGFAVSGVLRNGLAAAALALCAAGAMAAVVYRLAWAGRRALGTATAAWAVLLSAGPIAQAGVASALNYDSVRLLYLHLGDAMPWSLPNGIRPVRDVQQASDRLLASYRPRLDRAVPSPSFGSKPAARLPNIVLVVLESFRHDVFTREVMPQLRALADRGLRADAHHSGSNGSHYGFYSLMYGQSPVSYHPVIDSEQAPVWPSLLSELGYRNLYVTAADLDWMGMERFLGPEHFEVAKPALERDTHWEQDQAVVREAQRQLDKSEDAPTFLLLFLLSTHYDYSYPPGPEHSIFGPALRPKLDEHEPGQREEILNGYRNSARYLDGLLGPWLAGLDPEENLIIVTGDHAESLWDDGTIMHSSRLSEVQTRVPLAMLGAGIPGGTVLTQLSTHEDLLPTMIDALDLPAPAEARLFGESLLSGGQRRPYVPLVQVRAPGYVHDSIAFVSEEHRFGFTLDRLRAYIRFDGLLDENGLIRSYRATPREEGLFLSHLEDYLRRVSVE